MKQDDQIAAALAWIAIGTDRKVILHPPELRQLQALAADYGRLKRIAEAAIAQVESWENGCSTKAAMDAIYKVVKGENSDATR